MQTVSDLTERELIARIQQRLPSSPDWLLVGIGDDAAVVEPERNRVEVLTTDMLVEGIHFDRLFTPPDAIGHRALAANLSDLASMGATPLACLLSLALPAGLALHDFDGLVSGFSALAASHRLHLIGGNLTRSPGPLIVDITLTGSVKRRQALVRSGARPGDVLYVSGRIGGAAAGLGALRMGTPAANEALAGCIHRFLYPEPRVRLGQVLSRNRAASACMDLSDGLADAVAQVAGASGVGATIEAAALPIDAAAHAWFEERGSRDSASAAISGGDDYELLFAVRPRFGGRLRTAVRHGGVPVTRIGVCTDDGRVLLRRTVDGEPVDEPLPRGYAHFR